MLIPTFKRLSTSDYPQEKKDFIEKLGFIINNSFEVVYEALNKKISLRQNVACSVREVTTKVDVNGFPAVNTGFSLDNTLRVEGCLIIQAVNLDNNTDFPTGAPFITFTQTQTGITINHIAGLPANVNFRLKIIAFS